MCTVLLGEWVVYVEASRLYKTAFIGFEFEKPVTECDGFFYTQEGVLPAGNNNMRKVIKL